MKCETAQQWLTLLLYGELSFDEEDALEQHLEQCQACQREREAAQRWHALLDGAEMDLPPGLLGRNRRNLGAILTDQRDHAGAWWRRAGSWLTDPPSWAKPIGAMAVFVLGFGVARMPVPATASRAADPAAIARVRTLDGDSDGRVRVAYDEVRPKEIVGTLSDESIRRVLLAAAVDPADPGLRVESLELLKKRAHDDVGIRRALLEVLRTDKNSGVRLRALEALKSYPADVEMRSVLCQVLLSDDNAGVRAQAIDLLTVGHEPEVAGTLQELLLREQDSYIRARSQKLLSAMKASAGTF